MTRSKIEFIQYLFLIGSVKIYLLEGNSSKIELPYTLPQNFKGDNYKNLL